MPNPSITIFPSHTPRFPSSGRATGSKTLHLSFAAMGEQFEMVLNQQSIFPEKYEVCMYIHVYMEVVCMCGEGVEVVESPRTRRTKRNVTSSVRSGSSRWCKQTVADAFPAIFCRFFVDFGSLSWFFLCGYVLRSILLRV